MGIIFAILILGIPLLDLGIKYYIENNMKSHEEKEIFHNHIIIRNVHNKGMIFNILDSHPKIIKAVTIFTGIFTAGWTALILSEKDQKMTKVSICMILGGAISNIYDRIVRKYVVDFFAFKTKWKKITNITFNLGDMFIFAGTIGMFLSLLWKKK